MRAIIFTEQLPGEPIKIITQSELGSNQEVLTFAHDRLEKGENGDFAILMRFDNSVVVSLQRTAMGIVEIVPTPDTPQVEDDSTKRIDKRIEMYHRLEREASRKQMPELARYFSRIRTRFYMERRAIQGEK